MTGDEELRERAERMVKNLPDMMTTGEVKAFFRVSRTTVGKWLDDGYFPGAMKLGRDWRIPKIDIIDLAIKLHADSNNDDKIA